MFTKTLAFAAPLPSPFTKNTQQPPTNLERPSNVNQYVIQLTIPSSEPNPNEPTGEETEQLRPGKAKSSIMVWAGIGRLKQFSPTRNGDAELNAYQRAMAEELEDGGEQSLVEAQFEGSRRLAEDWACAMPTVLQSSPVASSTLMNGIEADTSGSSARSGRAKGMAERLAKRFQAQVLLSLDIPLATSLLTSMESSGGMGAIGRPSMMGSSPGGGLPGMDPLGDKLYFGLEKALVRVLEQTLS